MDEKWCGIIISFTNTSLADSCNKLEEELYKTDAKEGQLCIHQNVKIKILTPPSLRILEMTSMYSTMLWAVSMKKQVTTASQVPADIATHISVKKNILLLKMLIIVDKMVSWLVLKRLPLYFLTTHQAHNNDSLENS